MVKCCQHQRLCPLQRNLRIVHGHLGNNHKCPDYPGVLISQLSLYDKAPFGAIIKHVDYAGVLIFKYLDIKMSRSVFTLLGLDYSTHFKLLIL